MNSNRGRNLGLMDSPRTGDLQESQWMSQVTEAMRQGLGQHGDKKGKWLTWDDLEDNKIAVPAPGPGGGYLPGGGVDDPPDMSPPKPLENLQARGGMTAIRILWDDPNIHYHYRVEVHKSATDDLGEAFLAGTTQGTIYQDVVGSDETTWYYWARVVKQVGTTTIEGPWNKTQGTPAAAASDPDWVLKDIEGKINDSHLNDCLSSEIEKIPRIDLDLDSLEEGLNTEITERKSEDKSIHCRIDTNVSRIDNNTAAIITESKTRATEDEALAKQITTLAAEVGDNKAAIQQESTVRASEDEVLAKRITTLNAEMDGNFAGIRDEMKVIVSDQEQLASRVGTVELDLEDTKGAIEQQFKVINDELDGIRAEYTVKLDVDGYVGGFGLVNDGDTITALWRVDVFGVGAPGCDSLVFAIDAEENRVVMDGALIKNASINTAQIGELDVDKLVGGTAEFVEANIRDASITNAKIGNVIKSNNYQAGGAGWILSKDGFFESQNAYIRGRIHGSEITGSVIQGSVIIGSDDMLIPTEADNGPGSTRYLTYIEPFSVSGSDEKRIVHEQNNGLIERDFYISFDVKSADFTGDGETNGVSNNFRRYKEFKISPDIDITSNSKEWYRLGISGHTQWILGCIKAEYTISGIPNTESLKVTLESPLTSDGQDKYFNFDESNKNIRINGSYRAKSVGIRYDEYSNVVGDIKAKIHLINYTYSGNEKLRINVNVKLTVKKTSAQSQIINPFNMFITFNDYSYDKNKMMIADTDSEVLAALEKQFLSSTELFKNREKWRLSNDS